MEDWSDKQKVENNIKERLLEGQVELYGIILYFDKTKIGLYKYSGYTFYTNIINTSSAIYIHSFLHSVHTYFSFFICYQSMNFFLHLVNQ